MSPVHGHMRLRVRPPWWRAPQVFRKAAASAITLGSGASLGPEAPSVELGANTAAVITPKWLSRRRQRMLLAAGAAAGVSAAFDAPVAGALFAVECGLKSSRLGLDRLSTSTVFVATSVASAVVGFLRAKGQALGFAGASSHLVGRIPYFSTQPHLLYDVVQVRRVCSEPGAGLDHIG
jgi:H+/Cl- antiporter ClcA